MTSTPSSGLAILPAGKASSCSLELYVLYCVEKSMILMSSPLVLLDEDDDEGWSALLEAIVVNTVT